MSIKLNQAACEVTTKDAAHTLETVDRELLAQAAGKPAHEAAALARAAYKHIGIDPDAQARGRHVAAGIKR